MERTLFFSRWKKLSSFFSSSSFLFEDASQSGMDAGIVGQYQQSVAQNCAAQTLLEHLNTKYLPLARISVSLVCMQVFSNPEREQ